MSPIRTVRVHISGSSTASRGDLRTSRAGIGSVSIPTHKLRPPAASRLALRGITTDAAAAVLVSMGQHPAYELRYNPQTRRFTLVNGRGGQVCEVSPRDGYELTVSVYLTLLLDDSPYFQSYCLTPAGKAAVSA